MHTHCIQLLILQQQHQVIIIMRVLTIFVICATLVGCWGSPVPTSHNLKEAEPTVGELETVESPGEEVTRKKKSTTTFCVEIRPSSPSQQPFQVCEPQGYSAQQATSYAASSAQKPSHVQSYENKEYPSAPTKPAATSPTYASQSSPAAAYAAPAKTYSAPAHANEEHTSTTYQQHTPYQSVTSYRNADVDMMSRMGEMTEENDSHSVEDMGEDHMMRAAYGEYGGASSSYGASQSYSQHQPLAYISPLPKHKKKLLAHKLGKLGGHNGLVISCQPSLTGYASSVPTSGGYSAGYRSSTPTSSYRPQYGPSSSYKPPTYAPPKQYPSHSPSYKPPAAPSYPPIAYKAEYAPSSQFVPSYSSYTAPQSYGVPAKQQEYGAPAAVHTAAPSYGSGYAPIQHPSPSAAPAQEIFPVPVASYGQQQQFAYGAPFTPFGSAQAKPEVHQQEEAVHVPEGYGAQISSYAPQSQSYAPQAQTYASQSPAPVPSAESSYVRPGTYDRSSTSIGMKSASTEKDPAKKVMSLNKERASEMLQVVTDKSITTEDNKNSRSSSNAGMKHTSMSLHQETESKARSASGGDWMNQEIVSNARSTPGGGWRSEMDMGDSMREAAGSVNLEEPQVPVETEINNML